MESIGLSQIKNKKEVYYPCTFKDKENNMCVKVVMQYPHSILTCSFGSNDISTVMKISDISITPRAVSQAMRVGMITGSVDVIRENCTLHMLRDHNVTIRGEFVNMGTFVQAKGVELDTLESVCDTKPSEPDISASVHSAVQDREIIYERVHNSDGSYVRPGLRFKA